MDPSARSISYIDLDSIPSPSSSPSPSLSPSPLVFPKIEPQLKPAEAEASNGANPNSVPIPLRQLSPDPDNETLLSEYRAAAQLLLLSYSEKFRRPSATPAPTDPGASTAIVPAPADPGASTAIVPASADAGVSTAIVPAPADAVAGDLVVARKRKKKKYSRSGEMVRVSYAEVVDRVLSRNQIRRTRITFESLRSLMIRDAERPEGAVMPGLRNRPDVKAAILMSERGLWLHRDMRIIGTIPGIHIGDIFFYRMELCVVGLHGQTQAGIDYVAAGQSASGEPIATSIVVSGGYEDDDDSGEVLVYTGHGGRERNLMRHSVDQKLEGGNLALERSMNYGIEIRVIRGCKSDRSPTGKVYVYDGLYNIVDCWQDLGKSGFSVYKYKLVRIEGQVEMGSVALKLAEELKKDPFASRPIGCLSSDISKGKEKIPVSLFNDIDDDQEPMLFEYLVRPIYTRVSSQSRMNGNRGGGCGCVSNCSTDCYCARRNGGDFAYDGNGILLRGKPLIYECGPSCSCPPSCSNRVSQKGVRNRLEVFRSMETGWGVRSFDLIPAGAFICEFIGVVITKPEAEAISLNGASLVDSNRFPARWLEWGDMSSVFPEYVPPDFPSLPELSFSIDVSRVRNVACYLSHSCSPNVFLQFVLYDHYNVAYPHLMVFAMENIPPLRELSIDYGVG